MTDKQDKQDNCNDTCSDNYDCNDSDNGSGSGSGGIIRNVKDDKFLASDIFDDLMVSYSKKDDRIRWICMGDLMHGPMSYCVINCDEHINEFIDEFINELVWIKRKNGEIENYQSEFNRNRMYSRISFCLKKWYI